MGPGAALFQPIPAIHAGRAAGAGPGGPPGIAGRDPRPVSTGLFMIDFDGIRCYIEVVFNIQHIQQTAMRESASCDRPRGEAPTVKGRRRRAPQDVRLRICWGGQERHLDSPAPAFYAEGGRLPFKGSAAYEAGRGLPHPGLSGPAAKWRGDREGLCGAVRCDVGCSVG